MIHPLPEQATSWSALGKVIAPISYAWPMWLPNGLVTLVAAQPGKGKSALALRLCQTFIQGTPWPDGTRYTGRRGKVLWCECESAQAINLHRANEWGLRTDRMLCPLPDGTQDVKLDDPLHREAIARLLSDDEVRFAVIDSLRGAHGGDENSSKSIQVISWLAGLARDTGKPILLTHHLRKSTRQEVTLDRVRGSSAIIQPCRLVWALDSPFEDLPELVRLQAIKNNLGQNPPALGFNVTGSGLVFHRAAPPVARKELRPLERACALLKALLSVSSMDTTDIQLAGENAGISWATIKRAKDRLNVVAAKNGPSGKWFWRLPDQQPHVHPAARRSLQTVQTKPIAPERLTVFGIVSEGTMVLKTPRSQPQVAAPSASKPALCARWLRQSICSENRQLAQYTDLITIVPLDDPRAAEWNAAFEAERYLRIQDERLVEPHAESVHPGPLRKS